MKLAVSAIAWSLEDELEAFELLRSEGVRFIECVPARFLANPETYRQTLDSFGLSAVACQALLFGTTGLHLFQEESARTALMAYLVQVSKAAQVLGARALVFGSPKNRWLEDAFYSAEAGKALAEEFFRTLGKQCASDRTALCVEPNPVEYGCNFLTDTFSAGEFVKRVGSSGIALNLDLGTTIINSEDHTQILERYRDAVGHIHVSEPQLVPVRPHGTFKARHESLANALRSIRYSGYISIEMAKPKMDDWRDSLKQAVAGVRDVYGAT